MRMFPKIPSSTRAWLFLLVVAALCGTGFARIADAHHILGRPSYNLNEDSNTPSSMEGEALIGDYSVTYMVFPAFPKPEAPGRINLYITGTGNGGVFDGEVAFLVRESSWLSWAGFGKPEEPMGVQRLDDGVFRQPFAFNSPGSYVIAAKFESGGEPYVIEFPVRVGPPPAFGPIGITVGFLVFLLLAVTLIQRRRAMTGKIRASHEQSG